VIGTRSKSVHIDASRFQAAAELELAKTGTPKHHVISTGMMLWGSAIIYVWLAQGAELAEIPSAVAYMFCL
jgi:hypothetical protein